MAKYNENGSVDIVYDHPVYGLIPNTAIPDNPDPDGAARWDAIMAGEYGAIDPYVPPTQAELDVIAQAELEQEKARRKSELIQEKMALSLTAEFDEIDAAIDNASINAIGLRH